MDNLVAVSFEPVEGGREAILAQLQGFADVVFLPDLETQARAVAVARARVLFASHFFRGEITEDEWEAFAALEFIQTLYAGVEKTPFHLVPKDVLLASNAGTFAEPLAEQVLTLALACAKRLFPKYAGMKAGQFDRNPTNRYLGNGTCLIVGFGGIGKAVAGRMRALGMKIWGVNRSGRSDEPVNRIGTMADLDEMLPEADVVVLCLPLTPGSRGMVNHARLRRMKPDAILVNVGRGALVEEEDLYRHLLTHPDFFYGADVWWDEPDGNAPFSMRFPFLDRPNVAGTPHNADRVPGMDLEATGVAARNIRRFLEKEKPLNIVNPSDYSG
ncbi:MAG: 2-hydroxyacid dehydrogenase [Synergistales bacterium]